MFIKKLYITCTAIFAFGFMNAQETTASVEKSLFSVQTGVIGVWASHEARLANQWALRTEIGLDLWYYETYENYSLETKDKGSFLAPSLSVEPRWYYNLQKRANKGKLTANNSANFLTLSVKYFPDLFKLGGPDNLSIPNQMSFTPKWGIRRAIAQSNFNYEAGLGIGYLWYMSDNNNLKDASDVMVDLHLRIGYTF